MAVAEQGSFTKAAEQLGLSPSSLSQIIRTFEERLGVRLLHRTTRSVALTEAGKRLLLRIRPALSELDTALADVGQFRERPAGVVRVRALRLAFRTYVEPILEPPLNLLLGSDALARVRARLTHLEEDLGRWESTTLSTDYAT